MILFQIYGLVFFLITLYYEKLSGLKSDAFIINLRISDAEFGQ